MRTGLLITLAVSVLCFGRTASAADTGKATNVTEKAYAGYVFDEFRWSNAPAGWPEGAKMASLEGSPSKVGPYTVRYKLPAGYRMNPHWYSSDQRVTVLSGILNVGMPPAYDKTNSKKVGAGSFAFIPAKMRHSIWTDEETIIQVHGQGPAKLSLLFDESRNSPQ